MEDHRLKAFCLLAEMKSFSRAAEAKFMTQSAMSHLVKKLEDDLGVRLINRHSRTISLTPAGKAFYRHARRILDLYRDMEDDVYSTAGKVKGPLHIGASPTVAACMLSQVLYGFLKKYPEVRIEVSVSNTGGIIGSLLDGTVDIGLVEGDITETTVHSQVTAEDEIVLVASDENPLSAEESVDPARLVGQPFILPEKGSGIREFIETFLKAGGIDPGDIDVSMTIGSPELVVQMVQAGMGISFVSKWAVFRAVKEGSLKILPLRGGKLRRKIYTLCAEEDPSTLTVRSFRDFVREFRFFVPF